MYPPELVPQEGQEKRPLPPLCPDRSGCCARSRSHCKGPASKRTAQCHGCSISSRPAPSCLPACLLITALLWASYLYAFLSLLSFQLTFLPFFSPTSFLFILILCFLLSFLGPGALFQLVCFRLSGSQSLSGSVPWCPLGRSLARGPAEG